MIRAHHEDAVSTPTDTFALRRIRSAEELADPATQVVRDRDAYLGQSRDIGRRLTDEQFELFVTGEPAEALLREIQRLAPHFIALHDLGTSTSLRLLASMAKTTQAKVMRLSIRRQGHGVALATLQFVEITASDGTTIRAYSTDIDADTQSRHDIARVLLAESTLSVLIVGELPQHALRATLKPLQDEVQRGHWPNRQMLLIPLGMAAALAAHARIFADRGLDARVTPQAIKPSDAWSYIGGAWHRLIQAQAQGQAKSAPAPARDDSEAPTEPMGLRLADQNVRHTGVNWVEYVHRCASLKGMVSCEVFDRSSGRVLAHVGGRSSAELVHALAERVMATAGEVGSMLGIGPLVSDCQISYAAHHVLLHAVPSHPGIVLYAVLDATLGNLPLVRTQLQRLDPA